jgi:hypothetical protein
LAENLQREGLTDLEKANGIKGLVERFQKANEIKDNSIKREIAHPAEKVAQLLGYSPSTIWEFLRLAGYDDATKEAEQRNRGLPPPCAN